MSKNAKPVGLWVRVSTDMQVKADSPANQLQRLRDFVAARGWKEVALYQLDGVSGAISLDHPEAKRMVRDLEKGTIKALVATRFARVARDGVVFRLLHRKFKELGAELISIDENIDSSTPAGEFMIGMIADLAEMERKETSSRVRASVKVRARAGKRLGGDAPFGYQWKDGQLAPHAEEAPVRKLVHELFLELRRKKAVAAELNSRGYLTRRGKKWTDSTIDWLLRDPTAKGLHRKNYTQSNGPGKAPTLKDEEEVIYHPVPAVVPPEIWDAALAALEEAQTDRARRPKRARQLFAGVVVCECDSKMYVRAGTEKYTCYKCNNKVLKKTVEEAFLRRLRHHPVDVDTVAALLQDSNDELMDARELLRGREQRESRIERQLSKALELHAKGALDEASFERVAKPLQDELRKLREEIPMLKARVEALEAGVPDPAKLIGPNPTMADVWSKLDFEGRRLLVEALVIRFKIEKEGRLHLEMAHLAGS